MRWQRLLGLQKSKLGSLNACSPPRWRKIHARPALSLARDSRHPQYNFYEGFLRVEIDERRGQARLSDYEGRLDEFPADVGAVLDVVRREARRLFEREFDGNKFFVKLHHHYAAVIKKENLTEGAPIPIRSITSRLGKNEKGFRTDEFLIDLSRLFGMARRKARDTAWTFSRRRTRGWYASARLSRTRLCGLYSLQKGTVAAMDQQLAVEIVEQLRRGLPPQRGRPGLLRGQRKAY